MEKIGIMIRKWDINENGKHINPSKKNLKRQILTLHRKLKKRDTVFTEYSGPKAAKVDLLDKKVFIICEMEKTNIHLKGMAYDILEALNMKLRFMDPEEHDRHLAFVSHLSHISSFMLGKTVMDKMEDEKNIFDMAGSGFASTVRLAKSSPAMWAPIMEENKKNILDAMSLYIASLSKFRDKIIADDYEGLANEMAKVNKIRDTLDLGQ